ncbi:sensor histidine kinase [Ornithinibacillus salinisoli]|uniref:histidine kinase n=1 Tax=Ornithinibacillus salinisoli TaxID=1848459 RepID=A0ABW4VYE0_9BACI
MKENRNSIIIFVGFSLITYGLAFPSFVDEWSVFIMDYIQGSILQLDSGRLVVTSFAYIAKYVLLFFFIYFGAMLVASALAKDLDSLSFPFIFITLTILVILLYNYVYNENFSYLGHMIILGIVLLLQLYIPKQKHFYIIFSIILFLTLVAVHWIHLIPALTRFGFGSNDLALSIKIADHYLTNNNLLNTLSTIFFLVFLVIAIILTFLIHLVNKQLHTFKKYQEREEELKETQIALVESTVYQEINMLVHDLKTPLVTLEGLISLLEMKMQHVKDEQTPPAYFSRLSQAIQKMNDMISEILYEDIKRYISVDELVEYVISHLSLNEQQIKLRIEIEENLPLLFINKIRFSRAISNLLENAITSFAGKKGYIHIHVKNISHRVLFRIEDNGPGIRSSHLENIWRDGFSTRNSSGLGLSFVKRIVENHGGEISVNSIPGSYTQMNILLPIHKEGEKVNEYDNLNRG